MFIHGTYRQVYRKVVRGGLAICLWTSLQAWHRILLATLMRLDVSFTYCNTTWIWFSRDHKKKGLNYPGVWINRFVENVETNERMCFTHMDLCLEALVYDSLLPILYSDNKSCSGCKIFFSTGTLRTMVKVLKLKPNTCEAQHQWFFRIPTVWRSCTLAVVLESARSLKTDHEKCMALSGPSITSTAITVQTS